MYPGKRGRTMPHKRLRQIVWVSLVAFLAADPHVVTAVTACLPPAIRHPAGTAKTAALCCERCAAKARSAGGHTPQSATGCCPSRTSCPKCPACPIPGGCALCNVGKVPCLPPVVAGPTRVSVVVFVSSEAAPFYSPPFSGRLRRPPKA